MKNKRYLITIAWITIIMCSLLPDIVCKEIFKLQITWLYTAKLVLVFCLLIVSLVSSKLAPLSRYFTVLTIFHLLYLGSSFLKESTRLVELVKVNNQFVNKLLLSESLDLVIALILLSILFILLKKKNFMIKKGDSQALAQPIKFILDKPMPWKKFGLIVSAYLGGGTLAFLLIAGGIPSLKSIQSVISLIPVILLFAAANAFSEEISIRISVLSVLEKEIGEKHALLISSIFFGLFHYYGVPYGVIGVIMSSILGYILGKSVLETRGIYWAWFIHFIMDVIIFIFLAMSTVAVGGVQ